MVSTEVNILRIARAALVVLLCGAAVAPAMAQQGIYTCVDAKGRKITADRPIVDCMDREQKELNPGGTVKRKVGPSLTAEERAAEEDKARKQAEERARQADEKRRDRALLTRFPTRAVHDQERVAALMQVDEVIKAAAKRMGELAQQRSAIDVELEFFKQDTAKAPPRLKRQIDENNQSVAVQKRFIADQEMEKQRINARFDEELGKLKQLWAPAAATATAPASAPKKP